MKKTIKIIALCLSILALTALFTGCDALDEAKNNHALLSDDKKTISFRGETYKLLPEEGSFYAESNYPYQNVHVTDEDVPVLLKDMCSYASDYYERKDIFSVWINEDFDVTHYSETFERYYCNEKDFDKYIKALEENELDHIGFEYEGTDKNYAWFYTLDIASEDVSKEILSHIKNPEAMTNELYSDVTNGFDSYCLLSNLYTCDSEGILADVLAGFDIFKDGDGKAYLVNYDTERAVELSDTVADSLKDEYFFGDYYEADEDDLLSVQTEDVQVEYIGLF